MIRNFPEVLNFNRLFLKLDAVSFVISDRFIALDPI